MAVLALVGAGGTFFFSVVVEIFFRAIFFAGTGYIVEDVGGWATIAIIGILSAYGAGLGALGVIFVFALVGYCV